MISVRKRLQDPIDMLRLFGELNLHQHLSNGHVQRITEETEASHIAAQHILREFIRGARQDGRHHAPADRFFEADEVLGWGVSLLTFRYDHDWISGQAEGLRLGSD